MSDLRIFPNGAKVLLFPKYREIAQRPGAKRQLYLSRLCTDLFGISRVL